MEYFNSNSVEYQSQPSELAASSLLRKVYVWMALALAITGVTAMYVAGNPSLLHAIFATRGVLVGLCIAEIALVMILSAIIDMISSGVATLLFLLYAVLNGVTLSSIFVIYDLGSIASTFYITAGTFAIMAIVGSVTKKDLTRIGYILSMCLIGLLIALVVNLFMHNSTLDLIISCVGVVIFTGLTAYDSNKIKQMVAGCEEDEVGLKVAMFGALELYLDFINLFLYLLRFFGRQSKN